MIFQQMLCFSDTLFVDKNNGLCVSLSIRHVKSWRSSSQIQTQLNVPSLGFLPALVSFVYMSVAGVIGKEISPRLSLFLRVYTLSCISLSLFLRVYTCVYTKQEREPALSLCIHMCRALALSSCIHKKELFLRVFRFRKISVTTHVFLRVYTCVVTDVFLKRRKKRLDIHNSAAGPCFVSGVIVAATVCD